MSDGVSLVDESNEIFLLNQFGYPTVIPPGMYSDISVAMIWVDDHGNLILYQLGYPNGTLQPTMDIPTMGQGPAVLLQPEDLGYENDVDRGYTHTDLHRRIYPDVSGRTAYEVANRVYLLTINGVNSYRTTTITTHDESSTTDETP